MARPEKHRIVFTPPIFTEFKPSGIAGRMLETEELSLDEFEALRLADYENMSHSEAALEMEISRSTFTRLIEKARKKLVNFLIHGKKLTIDGGNIHFKNNIIKCNDCGNLFNINISQPLTTCPSCNSQNLYNLAGGFGHGECCTYHKK